MKELSIEEKATRYDEVVNKLKRFMTQGVDPLITRADAQDFFPELKESEDERIRKALIGMLKDCIYSEWHDGVSIKECIAWLEKQEGHAKFINGIQVGDKVTRNEDGVLVNLSQLNRVAKKQGEQKPAWSEEDEKMLSDIIKDLVHPWNEYIPDRIEDEIKWLKNRLKTLRERVQPQPKQEWSEEDKKLIDDTCHLINTLASGYGEKVTEPITFSGVQIIASIKDRLRALVDNRPQNHWRPTEEQMKYLYQIVTECEETSIAGNLYLESLYNDLKKL